jgi:hypothetical protein
MLCSSLLYLAFRLIWQFFKFGSDPAKFLAYFEVADALHVAASFSFDFEFVKYMRALWSRVGLGDDVEYAGDQLIFIFFAGLFVI